MSYYFYCPKCGHEDRVDKLPRGTVGNIRDGWDTPINHYECSKCHNLDAGFMTYELIKDNISAEDTEEYFRDTIALYQNIRGIKDCKATFLSLIDYRDSPYREEAYKNLTLTSESCIPFYRYIGDLERRLKEIADMLYKHELQVKNYEVE